MLVFDEAQNVGDGVWREYEPGVNVKIRPIGKDKFKELKKRARRRSRGMRANQVVTNEDVLDQLTYRHMVADWEGIVDRKGNPIERTDEMVDKIMGSLNRLANWVADEAADLADDMAMARAGELKNLKGSHDGSDSGRPE